MSYLIAIAIGFVVGYISKSSSKKKTPNQIIKETKKFRYIYKDYECKVYVNDKYEYESKIVPKKRNNPSNRKSNLSNGVDYERAQQLNDRKIQSKYFYPKKELEDESNFFFNKKVVITGEFIYFPDRNDLAKLFWDVGADIDTGVGKYTNYLIVGSDYGPVKMKKAIEQGITIIDQDKLFEYFDDIE